MQMITRASFEDGFEVELEAGRSYPPSAVLRALYYGGRNGGLMSVEINC